MTDEPEFLRRWSRRKQAARKPGQPDPAPAEEAQDPSANGDVAAAKGETPDDADSPNPDPGALDLPDIDSLDAESDFTPFLKDGVPKELKNRALRKLWRVNPVFGQLDGLNDYDGDFTDSATVVKGLKTLYKVGRGFLKEPETDAVEVDAETAPADEPEGVSEHGGDKVEPDPEESADDSKNGNKIT